MKIFELAKELEVQSKDIIALFKETDEEISLTHMANLTEDQEAFVRAEYSTLAAIKEKEKAEKEAERLELERQKQEAERLAAEKAKEAEKNKKKTDKDYRPDEMIPCRSVFAGVLIFNGDHSGMTYTFNGMGDRRNIEYQDLKAGMLQQKPSMFNPDFIIEDENLIEDERWYELKQVYENMYDEKDILKVLSLRTSDFKKALEQLPVTARKTIITLIASQIEKGTFEHYNKAKIVDEVCGTSLRLKLD